MPLTFATWSAILYFHLLPSNSSPGPDTCTGSSDSTILFAVIVMRRFRRHHIFPRQLCMDIASEARYPWSRREEPLHGSVTWISSPVLSDVESQADRLKQSFLLVLKIFGLRGAQGPEPLTLLHLGEFHVSQLHFRVGRSCLLHLLLDRPRFSLSRYRRARTRHSPTMTTMTKNCASLPLELITQPCRLTGGISFESLQRISLPPGGKISGSPAESLQRIRIARPSRYFVSFANSCATPSLPPFFTKYLHQETFVLIIGKNDDKLESSVFLS